MLEYKYTENSQFLHVLLAIYEGIAHGFTVLLKLHYY